MKIRSCFGLVIFGQDHILAAHKDVIDMEVPEIYAYLILSVVLEKFEAVVSLGDVNSRYKDFYDIYILAGRYDPDGEKLKEAVRATFDHRGPGFDDIFAFTDEFAASAIHQNRWKAFFEKDFSRM